MKADSIKKSKFKKKTETNTTDSKNIKLQSRNFTILFSCVYYAVEVSLNHGLQRGLITTISEQLPASNIRQFKPKVFQQA